MAQNQGEFPVSVMCRVLHVSQSGYYAWRKRQPSARQVADDQLSEQIRQIFWEGRGVYGSPRVHAALHQHGIPCGRKRVARLMRRAGLSVSRKLHRVRTTDSQHTHPVAANVLQRNFPAQRPNEKWGADITGVWTQQGWLYLAGIVDCYSRLLVGWAMSAVRGTSLPSIRPFYLSIFGSYVFTTSLEILLVALVWLFHSAGNVNSVVIQLRLAVYLTSLNTLLFLNGLFSAIAKIQEQSTV